MWILWCFHLIAPFSTLRDVHLASHAPKHPRSYRGNWVPMEHETWAYVSLIQGVWTESPEKRTFTTCIMVICLFKVRLHQLKCYIESSKYLQKSINPRLLLHSHHNLKIPETHHQGPKKKHVERHSSTSTLFSKRSLHHPKHGGWEWTSPIIENPSPPGWSEGWWC